jgi:uncharacterized DUF497 family protein
MRSKLRFEWNAQKAASNIRKHGIGFEVAKLIFEDPLMYESTEEDEHGEIRWRAIGEVGGKLLFVSYASFEEGGIEVYRLISARKASRQERRAYERSSKTHR